MNEAICSLLTSSAGQASKAGGLQPIVTSLSANHEIDPWNWFDSGTSLGKLRDAITAEETAVINVSAITVVVDSRRKRPGVRTCSGAAVATGEWSIAAAPTVVSLSAVDEVDVTTSYVLCAEFPRRAGGGAFTGARLASSL